MDRIRSSGEAPAVLAGSLAAFPLLDVLSLLATTRHSGELKVVREGADEHFWVDGGDLVDSGGGATGRLFDLACAEDAWFTVTSTSGVLRSGARMALSAVVEHLAPRLAEWQMLRTTVPLASVARMASSTTLPEVHLRAEQWQLLSRLGDGRRVGDVVEESDGAPIETLRLLRELAETGLVSITPAPADDIVAELHFTTRRLGGRDTADAWDVGGRRQGRTGGNGRGSRAEGSDGGHDTEDETAPGDRAGHRPEHLAHHRAEHGDADPDVIADDPSGLPAQRTPGRTAERTAERSTEPRHPTSSEADPPLPPTSLMPPPLVTRPWVSSSVAPRS